MGGKGTVLEKGKGTGKNQHKSLRMKADIYPVVVGFKESNLKLAMARLYFHFRRSVFCVL